MNFMFSEFLFKKIYLETLRFLLVHKGGGRKSRGEMMELLPPEKSNTIPIGNTCRKMFPMLKAVVCFVPVLLGFLKKM